MNGPSVLWEALDAIRIESASSYIWLGQRIEVRAGPGDREPLERLETALANRLYSDFYSAGGIAPPGDVPGADREWVPSLMEVLSAANSGRGSPLEGWVVVARDGSSIVVEREGLRLWADLDQVIAADVRPGAQVIVMRPKESVGSPDGFYTAYGDAGDGAAEGEPLDRFYWSIRPEGRASLVAELTARLNAAGLPFRLKVLNDPRVVRCDAGVLYTPSRRRASVATELAAVLRGLAVHLRADVPALTLPLAPGLAFAEDPPGRASFGEHRCRLLASALVEAHRVGAREIPDRAAIVADRLIAEGLSLDSPHLNPGSDPRDDPAFLAA